MNYILRFLYIVFSSDFQSKQVHCNIHSNTFLSTCTTGVLLVHSFLMPSNNLDIKSIQELTHTCTYSF